MNRSKKRDTMKSNLEKLKELLDYCPSTGQFFWKVPGRGRRKNKVAGCKRVDKKYITIRFGNREYRAHHLAWYFVYGELPKKEIDHKNRNALDNRISNLRLATRTENSQNRNTHKNSVTGYKGVFLNKRNGGYRAYINANRKSIFLGHYDSAEMAALAYDAAAKEYHGEFARLNFPEFKH